MELLKRLATWIDGNVGSSSSALFLYMARGDVPQPFDAPSDSGDRGRCIVLLKTMPEWVERLKEIEALEISGRRNDVKVFPWNEQIPLILKEMELGSVATTNTKRPRNSGATQITFTT